MENLPSLDRERLTFVFKHVYDISKKGKIAARHQDQKLLSLLKILQAMQFYNFSHRSDDTQALYDLMNDVFYLDPNSEGTTYRLALILAVKELYGFTDDRLVLVMRQLMPEK